MSTLRAVMMRIWAALWVRWQLLRATLRPDRPALADAPDYYLATPVIPADGVDYPLAEIPPEVGARLDAVGAELVARGAKVAVRRDRRRRATRRRALVMAGTTLVTLAVLGAGASALISGSTGVAEVDELLGIQEQGVRRAESVGDREIPGLQPKAGSPVVSVELWDGTQKLIATSYVDGDDQLCSAVVLGVGNGGGAIGCAPPSATSDRLTADGIVVPNLLPGPVVPLRGYIAANVSALRIRSPYGPMKVALGEPWHTGLPDVPSMRPFLAVVDPQSLPPGTDPGRALDPRSYRFTVQFDDGREQDVVPDAPPAGG